MDQQIKVVCRFRPLNKLELSKGSRCSVTALTHDTVQVTTQDNSSHTFSFDRLFGTNSEQADVYDYSGKPLVDALFQGFNGCLLAYGQVSVPGALGWSALAAPRESPRRRRAAARRTR